MPQRQRQLISIDREIITVLPISVSIPIDDLKLSTYSKKSGKRNG